MQIILTIALLIFFQVPQIFLSPTAAGYNHRVFADIYGIKDILKDEEIIIVIARLGKREKKEMNQRRIYTVKTYLALMKFPKQKIIFTEGEPTTDYGGLEFYFKGKLLHTIVANKNQEIPIAYDSDRWPKELYLPKKHFLISGNK